MNNLTATTSNQQAGAGASSSIFTITCVLHVPHVQAINLGLKQIMVHNSKSCGKEKCYELIHSVATHIFTMYTMHKHHSCQLYVPLMDLSKSVLDHPNPSAGGAHLKLTLVFPKFLVFCSLCISNHILGTNIASRVCRKPGRFPWWLLKFGDLLKCWSLQYLIQIWCDHHDPDDWSCIKCVSSRLIRNAKFVVLFLGCFQHTCPLTRSEALVHICHGANDQCWTPLKCQDFILHRLNVEWFVRNHD